MGFLPRSCWANMVAASPRPAVVDDSTDAVLHAGRARGRGGGRSRGRPRGGRGQPRPLVPSRYARRPPPHGSSSLTVASADLSGGDLPGGSRRSAPRGSIRGRPVSAPSAALHVHPSALDLEPSASSSHSSLCPTAASGFAVPGFRPPALPALKAHERLRRRREIRHGKRPVAAVAVALSYQAMDFDVRPLCFPECAPGVQALAYPAPADPLSFPGIRRLRGFGRIRHHQSVPCLRLAIRKLLLIAVEEELSFFASVGNLQCM